MAILNWINRIFGNSSDEPGSIERLHQSEFYHDVLGYCKFRTEESLSNNVSTHEETQSYWVSVPKGWGFELLMSGTQQGIDEASKTKAIQIYKRLENICQQVIQIYSDAIEPESADCRDNRAEIIFVKSEESDYPNQPIYVAKLDHEYNVVGVEKSW